MNITECLEYVKLSDLVVSAEIQTDWGCPYIKVDVRSGGIIKSGNILIHDLKSKDTIDVRISNIDTPMINIEDL